LVLDFQTKMKVLKYYFRMDLIEFDFQMERVLALSYQKDLVMEVQHSQMDLMLPVIHSQTDLMLPVLC